MSDIVKSLLDNEKELCIAAVNTLLRIVSNILSNPNEVKYRSISLNAQSVRNHLLPAVGALELLFYMGFEEDNDKLVLSASASLTTLTQFKSELEQLRQRVVPGSVHNTAKVEAPPFRQIQPIRDAPMPDSLAARTAAPIGEAFRTETSPTRQNPPIAGTQSSTGALTASVLANSLLLAQESKLLNEMKTRLDQVAMFNDSRLQEAAKAVIPIHEFMDKATKNRNNINNTLAEGEKPYSVQDFLLPELLHWFKSDFFHWFNATCDRCHTDMRSRGIVDANAQEMVFGGHRVEAYLCENCGHTKRFARYFHPGKLLDTREGRCMEWASCFTLMCIALEMEARYVMDETDHVWTEVYSSSQDRWIHADSCEDKIDSPLMYEIGWKKKLSYVFAYSNYEVVDVVWRYSQDNDGVMQRRNRCREPWLANTLTILTAKLQHNLDTTRKRQLQIRLFRDMLMMMKQKEVKEGEIEGRLSGSLLWRLERGETELECKKHHIFTPCKEEVEQKHMKVTYCCSNDMYLYHMERSSISGWSTGSYESQHMFRKHEKDWKKVYLARREGQSEGHIKWHFSWAETGLNLSCVRVILKFNTFENGTVEWSTCCGELCHQGGKDGILEFSALRETPASTSLELSARVSSSANSDATGNFWQHAQLFRQNDRDTEPMLHVELSFK